MSSKTIEIKEVKEGMVTASDIFDKWGRVLLPKHTPLSNLDIKTLKRRGIKNIIIEDNIYNLVDKKNQKLYKAIERSSSSIERKLCEPADTKWGKEYKNLRKHIRKLVLGELNTKETSFDIENLRRYNEYTCVHSIDVATISITLGISLGLTESYLEDLAVSALFHDIGKLLIPKEIIEKPAKLTDEEFFQIKTHPMRGSTLLKTTPFYNDRIADGILGHHENWDGTGYPFGLHGNQISLFASIIHVADVYDALTTDRPYKKTTSLLKAYEYILANSGTMFNPEVVEVFKRKVQPLREGSIVMMNTGDVGIVVKSNREFALEPTVHLLGRSMILDLTMSSAKIERQISL